MAMPIWWRFERQAALRPASLAAARAGSRRAARMAMMAMTTSSSIRVNAETPNFKLQAPEKLQAPSLKTECSRFTLHASRQLARLVKAAANVRGRISESNAAGHVRHRAKAGPV